MKKTSVSLLLIFVFLVGCFTFVGCTPKIFDHKIEVTSSNIQHGRVFGDDVYKTGDTVTLTAVENPGATFVAWIKNSVEVSTEKEFSFTANAQTEGKYTAVFAASNPSYYKPSGFAMEYRHVLESENFEDYNVRITGMTIKLTMFNTNNAQTVYDKSDYSIEVLPAGQNSDTFKISSKYYLSKLKHYYLDVQIRYTVNGTSGVANKTSVIDFEQTTQHFDEQNNKYALTSVSLQNSSIQVLMLISFHPAGVTAPNSIIVWA
jgi:hypothetical protein